MPQPKMLVAPLVVCLTFASGPTWANLDFGLAPAVGVDVSVGINAGTQDFLTRTLPKAVREEALRLIKEALPLIDQSVDSYLTKVSSILDNTIDNLQCAIGGAIEAGADSIKDAVGITPAPVAKIEADWAKARSKLALSDSPRQLLTTYADLGYRVTRAACAVRLAPTAYAQVNAINQDLTPRYFAWWRLQSSCGAAATCLTFLEGKIESEVNAADNRDVTAVKAEERLVATKVQARFAASVSDVENNLISYWDIGDRLRLATYRRNRLAAAAISEMKKSLDSAEASIKVTGVSNDSITHNLRSLATCKTTEQILTTARTQLTTATGLTNAREKDPDIVAAQTRLLAAEKANEGLQTELKSINDFLYRDLQREKLDTGVY